MGCCGCVVGPADCGCGPSSGSSGARVGEGSSTPSGEVVPWALYVTGLATDRAPVSSHAPSRSSGRTQTVSKSANSGLLTGVPSTWVTVYVFRPKHAYTGTFLHTQLGF